MNTLFVDSEITVRYFLNSSGLVFSKDFIDCADKQLSEQFEVKSGIKINKHISFTAPENSPDTYLKADISKLKLKLFVNHNWNPIDIFWKSKKGRVYEICDTDIDCNDIEFWMEPLDVVTIYKQMFPKETMPFNLKQLGYEIIITRFSHDCTFKIKLKEELVSFNKIKIQLTDFVNKYNGKSEKAKKFKGVVHNCKISMDAGIITCELDMGSAGFDFIKKFLLFLDSLLIAKSVEIC